MHAPQASTVPPLSSYWSIMLVNNETGTLMPIGKLSEIAHDRGAPMLAYLDWLRFFVVLSLAPFHAALSYTGWGSVYVYDDPIRNDILSGVGLYHRSASPGSDTTPSSWTIGSCTSSS